ncbi:MAG: hypothetical protein SWK76_16935 [Actinomycetota bacterium]|nr:hypothetical protein [Actinomycetota bacterium]
MIFSEKFNRFFEDPSQYRGPCGDYGVLYLLRRDIDRCLNIECGRRETVLRELRKNRNIPSEIDKPIALFPAATTILTGIDLLAKHYEGTDVGHVGRRFKIFIERYFDLDNNNPRGACDQEIIYQFRNALLHSYGLYSKKYSKTRNKRTIYIFKAMAENGPLIEYTGKLSHPIGLTEVRKKNPELILYDGYLYSIDLYKLYVRFEDAIDHYREDLLANTTLQYKFDYMYNFYGSIEIKNSQ